MSWSTVVGLVASGVFLARLLPQPIRLARTCVAAGVSPLAALNSVTTALAWTAYGIGARLPVVAIVSALAVVPSTWAAVLLVRTARSSDWVGATAWASVVAVAAATGHLGFVLAGSVLLTIGPQVVVAVRGEDLRGIAPTTMWIALADASLWGLYGIALGDGALMAYGVVLFSSATIVLLRIVATQPERHPAAGEDARGWPAVRGLFVSE